MYPAGVYPKQIYPGGVYPPGIGGGPPPPVDDSPCPYIPHRTDQSSQFEAATNNPFEFSTRTDDNTYAPGKADECR